MTDLQSLKMLSSGGLFLNEYRISKYDPRYRVDGKYIRNEWSSVADIGRTFCDGVLSEQECRLTINRYCQCAKDILQTAGVDYLTISDLEEYDSHLLWQNGQVLDLDDIVAVIKDCLWERCWCRLSVHNAFIHFGYELYMYVGCTLQADDLDQICDKHHLFSENRNSPYTDDEISDCS